MRDPEIKIQKRKKIYEVVKKYPGLHMRDIKRRVDMNLNLVRYHLGKLKKRGLIKERKIEGYNRYYAKEMKAAPEEKQKILAFLRKDIPLKIIVLLLEKDQPLEPKEISEEFDISPSKLSYHLNKMVKKDILEKEGNKYHLLKPDEVSKLLMEYKPPEDIVEGFIDVWNKFYL
ncbi:MAG: winged helix-turn-helix transcriptional regulator [Candidatus Natronoplasma sp.]